MSADLDKSSFIYGKAKDKYIIFACDSSVSEARDRGKENAAPGEKAARKKYEAGEKVRPCVED